MSATRICSQCIRELDFVPAMTLIPPHGVKQIAVCAEHGERSHFRVTFTSTSGITHIWPELWPMEDAGETRRTLFEEARKRAEEGANEEKRKSDDRVAA